MVLVSYIVNEDGRVTRVHLRNADAPPVLFAAVRDWLMSCRFDPATRDGRPIAIKIIQPFNFTLR
jgi:TonB family protein